MRLTVQADPGVGSFAVSPTSRDVVLAGKSGLYVVDMLDPHAAPRWLPLRNTWDVVAVKWSPHSPLTRVASTSNQKVLLWDLARPSDRAVASVLQSHRRAVTDISFAHFSPHELISASIDTSVCVFDLRRPQLPALRFTDFAAGAVQVRPLNRNENQIVSSHNHRIVLWDRRRANQPLRSFNAHGGECLSLELLPNGKLLTASADKFVKVFDLQKSDGEQPELQIDCGFPVKSAIPAPYEAGALVVPLRGGANTPVLCNFARVSGTHDLASVAVADGAYAHPVAVRNAAFVRSDRTAAHYDVVTWGADAQLRVWSGRALRNLPHASLASCKDDLPPSVGDAQSCASEPFSSSPAVRVKLYIPVLNQSDPTSVSQSDPKSVSELDRLNQSDPTSVSQSDPKSVSELDRLNQSDPKSVSELDRLNQRDQPDRNQPDPSEPPNQHPTNCDRHPKIPPQLATDWQNLSASPHLRLNYPEILLSGPWGHNHQSAKLRVVVTTPSDYPAMPLNVEIYEDFFGTVGFSTLAHLNASLRAACDELSRHNVRSLQFCVRFLLGDSVTIEDELASLPRELAPASPDAFAFGMLDELDAPQTDREQIPNLLVAHQPPAVIDSTPVPKACGAVWSNTGKLVCFFNARATPQRDQTPRPLDRVFADDSSTDEPFLSDSDDGKQEEWADTAVRLGAPSLNLRSSANIAMKSGANRGEAGAGDANAISHCVIIKDFANLWPCRRDLAEAYRLDVFGCPKQMTLHNAQIAAQFNRRDDETVWNLLHNYISSEEQHYCAASAQNLARINAVPYFEWAGGRSGFAKLLPAIAADLERKGNFQLLVGIVLALSALRTRRAQACTEQKLAVSPTIVERGVPARFSLHASGQVLPVSKRSYPKTPQIALQMFDDGLGEPASASIVMAPNLVPNLAEVERWLPRLVQYRRCYAKLLHTWGLDLKRAEVLKANLDDPLIKKFQIGFGKETESTLVGVHYRSCALCQTAIVKTFSFCGRCSHAMHSKCAQEWWGGMEECPRCGCVCATS